MQHACGSALVCDTLAVARHVCYERGQDVKAVTLDGTVIHKSGQMSGGASSGGSGSRGWSDNEAEGADADRSSCRLQSC